MYRNLKFFKAFIFHLRENVRNLSYFLKDPFLRIFSMHVINLKKVQEGEISL